MIVTIRTVKTSRSSQIRGYVGGRLVERFASPADAIAWRNKTIRDEADRAKAIAAYKAFKALSTAARR